MLAPLSGPRQAERRDSEDPSTNLKSLAHALRGMLGDTTAGEDGDGVPGNPLESKGFREARGQGTGLSEWASGGPAQTRAQGRAEAASVSWCGGFVWPFSGN